VKSNNYSLNLRILNKLKSKLNELTLNNKKEMGQLQKEFSDRILSLKVLGKV
jgi:hypothetical protein